MLSYVGLKQKLLGLFAKLCRPTAEIVRIISVLVDPWCSALRLESQTDLSVFLDVIRNDAVGELRHTCYRRNFMKGLRKTLLSVHLFVALCRHYPSRSRLMKG